MKKKKEKKKENYKKNQVMKMNKMKKKIKQNKQNKKVKKSKQNNKKKKSYVCSRPPCLSNVSLFPQNSELMCIHFNYWKPLFSFIFHHIERSTNLKQQIFNYTEVTKFNSINY